VKTLRVGEGLNQRAVLLPGNDLCAEFYGPLAEELASRNIGTTLLTMPGWHGQPALDASGATPLVDAVHARLTEWLPGGGTLIGHSLGGVLALLVAARRPETVRRLILLEPALAPWRWLARIGFRRYRKQVVQGDRTRFENEVGAFRRIHDPATFPAWAMDLHLEVRATSDPSVAEAVVGDLTELWPLPWKELKVPVLWVRGASSGLLGRIAQGRSPATHAVIRQAAHWLANERDADLADTIARFIGR
jgi:pimeloyl-ACP methyl ester carboxylesterase